MSSTILPKDPPPPPAELLQYLPVYRVLVCASCQYAIQPNAISRHLKDIHHIYRSRRRPYMQYVSKLHLDEPEKVIGCTAKAFEFPVPFLAVQDGLRCESEGCLHLCVSVKRMRSHWISLHKIPGQAILNWQPVRLQTFFRGNLLRYFTKSSCSASIPSHISNPDDESLSSGGHEIILSECHLTAIEHPEDSLLAPCTSLDQFLSPIDPTLCDNDLEEVDKELLRCFVHSTSSTIANDARTERLWKTTVPQLAHQHPFLMHGILACSALHLAHKNPARQQEYIITASSHQDKAMPLFRSAVAIVNDDNCDAIIVFSHLLVIYAFASELQDERLLLVETNATEDVVPTWLYFFRNGCSLFCEVWDRLESGPVKALTFGWEIPKEVSDDNKTNLVDYLHSVVLSQSAKNGWPENACRILNDAAVELAWAFSCMRVLGEGFTVWDALRIWPMRISVEYMNLLRSWHPGALILLAHYCILLRKAESHWYFEGRATRLLSVILHRLDGKWHSYVKWPLEEIEVGSSLT